MAREYFPAYHSYLEEMSELTDAEKGRLFTACLLYSKTGEAPQLSGNERYLFPSFRVRIDRDKKAYDVFAAAQSEKAKKRWHAPACTGISGNAETAKEKKKKKKNIPPQSPPGELFSRFWAMYPRKTAKQNALRAFERLNVTEALLTEMLAALAWQRRCEDWTKEAGKFIPYPATWLNQHRWEDEPPDKEDDPYDNVIT